MPLEIQKSVLQLVIRILGGTEVPTAAWLMRPGLTECGKHWPLVRRIYRELTNKNLPETMPPRERRRVDCVLKLAHSPPRIIEVDETQHFNCYRAATLPSILRKYHSLLIERHGSSARRARFDLKQEDLQSRSPLYFPGTAGATGKEHFATHSVTFSRQTTTSCPHSASPTSKSVTG